MWITWSRHAFAALAAVPMLSGCSAVIQWIAPQSDAAVNRWPDARYEKLFPYYAELCAVSQYRPLEGELGGIPGHAVLYLKGACRDGGAPYPRLEACPRPSDDALDPAHGSGVSVNRYFENVNWIAVPGKSLFFFGNLAPRDDLDRARFDATLQDAIDRGLYRGIELHPYPTEAKESDLADFVSRHSIGTDFALQFGRTVFCARVPLTRPMLERAMGFLNDLNREDAEGSHETRWSGYHDSCVHTVRNALAAAGVWRAKPVDEIRAKQLLNLAVPANEYVELAERTTRFPLDDFDSVYSDAAARRSLHEFGWLPARHGAMVETLHVHQRNELYDTRFRLLALEFPLTREVVRTSEKLADDARFVELRSNLLYFESFYERSAELAAASFERPETAERTETRDRYRAYLAEQMRDVRAKLDSLDAMEAPAGASPAPGSAAVQGSGAASGERAPR